jgi:hypothetical protein
MRMQKDLLMARRVLELRLRYLIVLSIYPIPTHTGLQCT